MNLSLRKLRQNTIDLFHGTKCREKLYNYLFNYYHLSWQVIKKRRCFTGVYSLSEIKQQLKSMGVLGLDKILGGGVRKGSQILIAGNPGAGKTILSAQFLYVGAMKGEKGVYASFAESKSDFNENMKTLGMDFEDLEKRGLFRYLDFATIGGVGATESIEHAMKELIDSGAERFVIDSISALAQTMDPKDVRTLVHSVINKMTKSLGVTVLWVSEVPFGESKIGYGIEEFVADGVILLKHSNIGPTRKMEIEILKMRGVGFSRSTYEFTISSEAKGISLVTIPVRYPTEVSEIRATSGIRALDKMLEGGLYNSSVTLLKGSAGTGKTAMCLHFVAASAKPDKSLFISFEEPEAQVVRLGQGMGLPMKKLMEQGVLMVEGFVPEALSFSDYYKLVEDLVKTFNPKRLVIDSLSAVRHVMPVRSFIEFVRFIQILTKQNHLLTFVTAETSETGMFPLGSHVTTMCDNLITLKFRERMGRPMDREIVINKTRGSGHEKRAVDFTITSKGIKILT